MVFTRLGVFSPYIFTAIPSIFRAKASISWLNFWLVIRA